MLRIWLGRTGTGKTHRVYADMAENMDNGTGNMLLLVPPQASHNTERLLAERLGDRAPLFAEALTFKTLANRIFEVGGSLAESYIDDNGRMLLLRNARDEVRDLLKVYGKVAARPEFIQKMLASVNELKLYDVSPLKLLEVSKTAGGDVGDRLSDLAYIYSAYDALLSGELRDPADMYDRMAEHAVETRFFEGKRIYMDGFNGFTPKEYKLIELMIRQAESVTMTFTADMLPPVFDTDDLFYKSYEMVSHFKSFAIRQDIPVEIEEFTGNKRSKSDLLTFLEGELMDGKSASYPGKPENGLKIVSAADRRSECEACAAQILAWARSGIRFRDMAVVCRTYEDYSGEIESVFRGCGIPVYMDNSVSVATKPLFVCLVAAMEACMDSFSVESMTALMKSGMLGIPMDDLDVLEYYVIRWGIRGSKWLNEGAWNAHPDGYLREYDDNTLELLKKLKELRKTIMEPLAKLKKGLRGKVRSVCEALYTYAVEIGLELETQRRAADYMAAGNTRLSDEYNQLWDIFCDTLDQFVLIAGEREYKPEEFLGMFRLLLSGIKVGAIPGNADQVTMGEAGRFRGMSPRCVYVLGNNNGVFPKLVKNASLIGDGERMMLREHEIRLDLTDGEQQLFEQFLAYQVFFSAREQLVLSYLIGQNRLPSDYVERARQLAPFAEGNPVPAASLYLMKNDPRAGATPRLRDAIMEAGYRLYENGESITSFPKTALDAALVESLYGSPLRMSPSRIEKYHSCKFAFFVEYGLGVREFRKASFSAIEAGELIHYIFEKLGRDAKEQGGFSNMEESTVLSLTEKYAGEFYDSMFDAPEYRSKRVDYLFERLTRDAKEIASNMYEEFMRSRFEPYLFEQSFGSDGTPPLRWSFPEGDLAVYGRMDRADRCVVDGKPYIRIIDYKTGAKDFNLTDLYYGLNVQLPMYLFQLVRKGEGLPAGFFYMPSRNELPDLPRGAGEEEVSEAKAKLIRYKGMANQNPMVLEAMDSAYMTPETRLPFVARNGSIRSDAPVADERRFGQIEAHMEKLLRKMTDEICQGDVKAEPFMKTSSAGCDYCRYRAVCKVYPGTRETMVNSLVNLNCKAFFEALDQEERENNAQTE